MHAPLNKLISNDRTGFLSGRYIEENARLIYNILHVTDALDIPGLLLVIDFEKAFNSYFLEIYNACFGFS